MQITMTREIPCGDVRPTPDSPIVLLADDGTPILVDEVSRRGDHVKIFGHPLHRIGRGRRVMIDRRGLDTTVTVVASHVEELALAMQIDDAIEESKLIVDGWSVTVDAEGYDPDEGQEHEDVVVAGDGLAHPFEHSDTAAS